MLPKMDAAVVVLTCWGVRLMFGEWDRRGRACPVPRQRSEAQPDGLDKPGPVGAFRREAAPAKAVHAGFVVHPLTGLPEDPRKQCLGRDWMRTKTVVYSNAVLHLRFAKVARTAIPFWSGRSQAVRLPKDFRKEGDEVRIRKQGAAVILEPMASDWAWLDAIAGKFSEDFLVDGRRQPRLPRSSKVGGTP